MSDFLPLMAPRVSSGRAEPAEPIAWFQVVAPRFTEAAEVDADETAPRADGEGVQRALFGSMESVIEKEERKRRAGKPEPADIAKMRADAAAEASRLITEAREQASAILIESREQGYAVGYAAGTAAGERDATRQLTQRADDEREAYRRELAAFVASLEETSRRAWLEMEPEILRLVFEISRKVIKMEVEINREAAVEVVKNALRRVADSTSVRIRVHADDLQTVRANREELYTLIDGIRKVEIVEDRRVGPGGCIVETDAGTIDARIDTQMEEIRKLLEQSVPAISD